MNAQPKQSDTLANPSRMPAGKLKLAVMWMAMYVISGLFVFGAIEISLRVIVNRALWDEAGWPRTRFPLVVSSIPGLGYELAPDNSTGDILTDSHGFRVRPADKEPVRHNILLVGDSIAYGMGVAYEKTFAPLLEASLTQALGEHTAVWNAAVPGYNTDQELLQMERMAPIVSPQLVIVQFCLNDYEDAPRLNPAGWLEKVQAPQAPSDAGFSVGSYLIGLASQSHALLFANQLRREFRESHPEWFPRWKHHVHYIPTYSGWERAKAALLRMDEAAKKRNARLLIVVFPLEPQLRLPDRGAQDDLVRFAQAHQLSMLDLYEAFGAHWREGLYIGRRAPTGPPDTMHLNERGHALASSEIARAILERSEYSLHK